MVVCAAICPRDALLVGKVGRHSMLLSVETVTSVYHPLSKYPAVQSLRFWMRVDEVHIVDGVVLPPDQLSLALDTYNRCC